MTTALISHADCLNHQTPAGHPERSGRMATLMRIFEGLTMDGLVRLEAPLCDDEAILRAHPRAYIDRLEKCRPDSGYVSLDPDTHMSPGSMAAARRAAGANVLAVDLVLSREVDNAFCAVRPPGHHAEAERAMGFCLLSNVFIGAMHALERHGLDRVGILDFDVHHGNGTSALAWADERVFFASSHEMPLFPGTGHATETGAHGQIVNVPLASRSGSAEFRSAWHDHILPALDQHKPQCVFISAGFDAHSRDPLATLNLSESDFAWATDAICDIADTHCSGRVVSTLEGGYDLQALAACVEAHLNSLCGRAPGNRR
ncbi:MAG: histone deacetylase family protein [Rhodobacteraceae bacterium]|nr:histone deacetylase family protein [Paracoccaceae bacterium]